MTVIAHLRNILAAAIEPPLADAGISRTDDRSGYTVARYTGRRGDFEREVSVVRDKWWSKNRGRFAIFLSVVPASCDIRNPQVRMENSAEIPLANLIRRGSDDWKIWLTDDAQSFVDTLRRAMREHGIPWLERLSDPDEFSQWIEGEGF